MGFDKAEYDHAYVREHYDRIEITVDKGGRDILRKLAAEHTDGSVNALIVDAIRQVYGVILKG